MGPTCNSMYFYMREAKRFGRDRHTEEKTHRRGGTKCNHRGKDWNDVAISQRTPGSMTNWKRQGMHSPLEHP